MNQIPEYVKTAIRAVAQESCVNAIKLTRSVLSSDWIEYAEVTYHRPFRVGVLNKPTLVWCRDYVRSL